MRTIGMFREIYGDKYPPFSECVSREPIEGKAEILTYLRTGETVAVAAGFFRDIFTRELIKDEARWQTDGVFDWRSDTAYYVERYNMALPEAFVAHVHRINRVK